MKNTTDKYLNDTNTHKAYLYILVTQPSKLRKKRQNHDPTDNITVSYLYEGHGTCMYNGITDAPNSTEDRCSKSTHERR